MEEFHSANASSRPVKASTAIAVAVLAFLLLVGAPVGYLLVGSMDSAPMIAVTNRIQPQQGWVKTGENVTPRNALLTDTRPGTMWRAWSAPQKVEAIDLESLAKAAGYTVISQKECQYNTKSHTDSSLPSCTLFAERDGFAIRLNASTKDAADSRVSIQVAFSPKDINY